MHKTRKVEAGQGRQLHQKPIEDDLAFFLDGINIEYEAAGHTVLLLFGAFAKLGERRGTQ